MFLSELIARRCPGRSLEHAGDVMTDAIGSASALIVRDDNDQIHAFHNVSRRGARLVQGGHAMILSGCSRPTSDLVIDR